MMKLDEDTAEALKKMKRVHELMRFLPQVDCGACGAPKCSALAEDVVQGRAVISQCIFVQRILEKRKVFNPDESLATLQNIWGKQKFSSEWNVNFNL
jgi:uncharacterized Fe-S cluster-containing protein